MSQGILFDPVLGQFRLRDAAGGSGGGGGSTGPRYETFTGPSASVTLTLPPTTVIVVKSGVTLAPGSGLAVDQYDLTGTTLTTPLDPGQRLDVYEWFSPVPVFETFAGPGTDVTLGMSPSIVIAVKNGVTLSPGSGLAVDQYVLSGATLTTPLGASDVLLVWEWL